MLEDAGTYRVIFFLCLRLSLNVVLLRFPALPFVLFVSLLVKPPFLFFYTFSQVDLFSFHSRSFCHVSSFKDGPALTLKDTKRLFECALCHLHLRQLKQELILRRPSQLRT
jgi:hypothetical protein